MSQFEHDTRRQLSNLYAKRCELLRQLKSVQVEVDAIERLAPAVADQVEDVGDTIDQAIADLLREMTEIVRKG